MNNFIIKETEMHSKRPDTKGNLFGIKWTTRIGFWNVRTLREYGKLKQVRPKKTWRRTMEDEIRGIGRS
jgi:hypothetical protein